jgi:hypothetical protein
MSLTCAKARRGDVINKNRTNFFIAVYILILFLWYKNTHRKEEEIGKNPTKKEDFPYLIYLNKKQEGDPKVILQREQTLPERILTGFTCS